MVKEKILSDTRIDEIFRSLPAAADENEALAFARVIEAELSQINASVKARPAAWMRRWAFDGTKPAKAINRNGRLAWPMKFKLLPVTQGKARPDDVPLYVRLGDTEMLATLQFIANMTADRLSASDATIHERASAALAKFAERNRA